jgi:hypothetical protein
MIGITLIDVDQIEIEKINFDKAEGDFHLS